MTPAKQGAANFTRETPDVPDGLSIDATPRPH